MNKSIGMAIRITEDNREQLFVVNGGIAPDTTAIGAYFVFPYDPDASCQILNEDVFNDNYRFANTENDTFFVDIDEI